MNANHTPGPWTHKATAGNHDFIIYSEAEDSGRDIALVRDFDEANARLIAAAPELLHACELALHYLNNPEDFDGDLAEIAFATTLENAINKAKGA